MAAASRSTGVRLTGQAQLPGRHPADWCGEPGTAARARVRLPRDVNEPPVDERSVASCRLPTSLKNEGATLLSFSVQ